MLKKLKNLTLLDIKNNLAVILLFPTLLGGLWQLLELSKMSISFIRFFSPTQLLPDGLLILFMLGLLYIAIQLGLLDRRTNFQLKIIDVSTTKPSNFINYYIKPINTNKLVFIENPIYKKAHIGLHIFQIILALLLVVFFIFFSLYSKEKFEFTFIIFLMFLTLFLSFGRVILTSIIVLFVLFMENKYDKLNKYFLNKPIQKSILKEIAMFVLRMLVIIVLLFLFLFFPLTFHKEYMLPENLKNLDSISSSLNDRNYTSNTISYFNDKYIFIEHSTEDKNITIEILKFDKLFSDK